MKKLSILLFVLLSFPLIGQEAETPSDEIEENAVVYEMNQKGDQFIALKLNLNIPYKPFEKLKVGGSGSLGYHHFIANDFTIGGNISFAYNQTLGSNVFYFVPFMVTATYQFEIGSWEIPVSFEVGGAIQNYINRTYFGLAIRPEIAGYYRFNQDWSFGLHTGVFVLPQWYSDPQYNYTGIIHDIGLSVRYHF